MKSANGDVIGLPRGADRRRAVQNPHCPDGIQFTFPPRYADGPTARYITHMFHMRCEENGIEHRLMKVKHPWTHGQVERMNRTIKEATVKRFHYDEHRQLDPHLTDFIAAHNHARRLKTLRRLTP